MRLPRILCFTVVVSFASSLFAAAAAPNEVLVKIREDAAAHEISGIEELADGEVQRIASVGSGTLLRVRSHSKDAEALRQALSQHAQVEYVEPNYVVRKDAAPNDPLYSNLWGLRNTAQIMASVPGVAGADIDAEAAWNVTIGSGAVVVAVIDTGVDYTHPDLAANMWSNPGGKGNAACGAGTHGFNTLTGTCNPMDDEGHGTHVAGTIGAVGNNGIGVAGVNWTASIMALKFLDSQGWGTIAGAVAAIDFAIQAKLDGVNVRVLSNSWGGFPFSKALLDVINKANANGILFVASAGNDNSNTDFHQHYPSGYGTANLISVAATDNRDQRAWFSNYGATTVHLAAPGVDVYSTMPGGWYGFSSGTSMAAPHVAGVATLVLAANPGLSVAQLKSAILDNTDPIPAMAGRSITGGRLNAAKAVGATPTPDFTIALNPVTRSVARGNSTSYTVTVNRINGFTGTVDLSASGLPAGTTATFTPQSTTSTATLVVATSMGTPIVTSATSFTVTGTGGALTRSTVGGLTTYVPAAPLSCRSFASAYGSHYEAPSAVAIGDVNRDGRADIVTAEANGNYVAIRYGGFSQEQSYGVGKGPASVALADLNGDGRLDIATANAVSHDVSILLGSAAGFNPAVQYGAGSSPVSLAVADFNRDGRLDLVTANNGSGNVSLLLGNGDGTFSAATHHATAAGPFWVTAADVDGDGRMDVAVANYGANSVSVLRGNGDGTFQAPLHTTAGTQPSSIATGDFDGNGKVDLAVSNFGSQNVSLLSGNGDGTFAAAVHFALGRKPHSIAAGDLDGDGRTDLVTANGASGDVSTLFANGFGSFEAPSHHLTDYEPTHVHIGDLSGDGRPDVLIAAQGEFYSGRVITLYNTGTCALNCGNFAGPAASGVGGTPDSAASGDFNGDGRDDLAIVDSASNQVAIRLGLGDGTFAAGVSVAAGTTPRGIAAADLNRDGRLDLAVGSSATNEVAILLGNGDGTFQNAVAYAAGTSPRSVSIGDFNGDGRIDLAVAARDANAVAILIGGGDGTFAAPVSYAAGTSPRAVAIGDFNRDGIQDLAVANASSNNVSILKGNANGTFQAAVHVAVGTTPRALVAADLNNDGRTDLAVANGGSNNVSLLFGNGDATFQAAVHVATGAGAYAIAVAHLNGDVRPDLVTANNASNDVSVLIGGDTGGFSVASFAAGLNPAALALGDFNRDGKIDVAVANGGAASFAVLLNTCPVPDLAVTKTHAGSISQGGTGSYTIAVSNVGALATTAAVTVVDTLPAGLSATAISGTGWTCVLGTLTCTRADALASGASYPPITLAVRALGSAPASVTNTVTVSGGGEVHLANSTASDPTTILPMTDLLLLKSHSGSFAQGASGRTYTLLVRNAGGLATSGTVTVTDTLPAGLAATSMTGQGWTCSVGALTCTRTDALAGGSSYPPIALTVNVAANAPPLVTNTATVSGGGDASPSNNTASDPTIIWSSQTCGGFKRPEYYPVNSSWPSFAIADFNNDGRGDVAVASRYGNSVSILPGAGDGTLGAAVQYTTRVPVDLAVGDLDRDGDLDLVTVSDESDGKVSILLGQGNGTFAPAVHYDVNNATYLRRVELADLDRDGYLDVIASGGTPASTLQILPGNGDGSVRAGSSVNVGTEFAAFAVADVNGDGSPDLVASQNYNAGMRTLLGNGDGTFAAPVMTPITSYLFALAAGDFNGDGLQDIIGTSYSSAVMLIGQSNGTFASPLTYSISSSTTSIEPADLNADGALDVVVSSVYGYITTLLGNGDGTLRTGSNYYVSSAAQAGVSDFDGDGRADLGFVSQYSDGVGIMLGGCPDLSITKTHTGTFRGGKVHSYRIRVTNTGGGSTSGAITVRDFLPAGLTATWLWSYPGTCSLATLTCTYNGTLGTESAWEIEVEVLVSSTAPTSVTNVATVSGGGDTNPANNTASDPTTIVHSPDLVITKTHTGTVWSPGMTGTYTITVGNVGTGPTSGTVTVVDSLPYGLSATAMSGTGWSCNVATRTCTRSDVLAATSTYPPITLTVTVLPEATSASNFVSVSGGGETDTFNSTASDFTRILAPPYNVVANMASATQVTVSWSQPFGNSPPPTYAVFRAVGNGSFVQVGTTLGTSFLDSSLTPNTTYLYKVRIVEGAVIGPFSTTDMTTTVAFSDDPIVGGLTRVRRAHIEELRTAVNAARAAAGLGPQAFTDPSLAGQRIKAIYITELRTALNQARLGLGLAAVGFTPGTTIKAAHINELRAGVR